VIQLFVVNQDVGFAAESRHSYSFFLFFVFAVLLVFNLGEDVVFSSPALLLALNTLFVTGTGIAVAVISANSFLKGGSNGILILGLATAVGGVAALVAGLAASISVDYNVALYNIGILASGGLQLLSAILTSVEVIPRDAASRKTALITAYSAITLFLVVITAFVVLGFAPTFFAASGPTPTRQWVLGIACTFFAISAGIFGWQYWQSKSPILQWYTMALALFAIGLFGTALYTTPNAVFNWMARAAQFFAGFYFLVGLLTTRKMNGSQFPESNSLSSRWADAFRNDRRQLDILFGRMLDGFAYHRLICDADGKPVDYVFLDVNKSFEEKTGLSKNRILGQRATTVIPGIEKDPADWIGRFGRVALTQEPVQFDSYSEALNKWFSISAYSPKRGYFVTLFEDITERKKAEEKLRESEERFFKAFELNPTPMAISFVNGEFMDVNRSFEKLTGFTRDEVIGKRVISLRMYSEASELEELIRKLQQDGHVYNFPITLNTKSMRRVNVLFSLEKIKLQNKPRVLGTAVDVTEKKQLQDELEKHSRNLEELVKQKTEQLREKERLAAIGTTAGMVGHDIRNPLQSIAGDLYLLGSDVASLPEGEEKESMKESIASIRKSAEYIDKIVQDLQDFAKPLNPVAQETDLEELCEDVLMKNDFVEDVEVAYEVQDEAKKLVVDADMLKRILSNLVSNAVQAMPNGGKVEIRAVKDADDVVITVEDTGVGIPEEVKPKLFTPLFTTKSKGQGFGLAAVKRMTDALGGSVAFESEVDKGTKFIVRLPSSKS
jgi:PAS domain S-box-containing protein